jgi:hypothetical protein
MTEHDAERCNAGESCKPCQLVVAKAALRKVTATKRVPFEVRQRVLESLVQRAKAAISPGAAFLLVVLVGCVPVEAIEQCDCQAALNHGLATKESNDPGVRAVGARQVLAWRAQRRALTGDDVPGVEAWPPIPAEFLPPAPQDAMETRDARPTRNPCELPGAGTGPCGCEAKQCSMPCTGYCPGGCVAQPPGPTSAR